MNSKAHRKPRTTQRNENYVSGIMLMVIFIILRTLNQIFFKSVALGPGGSNYFLLTMQPLFYVSCGIFFAQALVWLMVLRRLSLSIAYPFNSITFITLLMCGVIFFGESMTLGNLLGSIVIMSGVVIIAGDQRIQKANSINVS